MMALHERVGKVFKSAIGVSPDTDKDKLVYNEIPEWDSVAHMMLVAALEEEFDCMLDMDDILDMSSYDKAVEIMAKYV